MVGMVQFDKDLARKRLNDLIAQFENKFEDQTMHLRYRLGLLEGVDIFGESSIVMKKIPWILTIR